MKTNGKILFYNQQIGQGLIITKEKLKVEFDIQEWDDYDIVPAVGLSVIFNLQQNRATQIEVLKDEAPQIISNAALDKENQFKKEDNVIKEEKIITKSSFEKEIQKKEKKKNSAPKCKNKDLARIGDELNALLNDSSDNISSLNAKISLSMDIADTMHQYFDNLTKALEKRQGYKKVNGRLDYSLAKRFLWTTFNNLIDIDEKIVTLRISSISQDLKFVSKLKENFDRKVKYPLTAFEDIFLSSQVEYTLVKQMTQEITDRLNLLTLKEEKLSFEKQKKQKEIEYEANKENKQQLIKELKTLNGTYVDIVHMMAKLHEIHKKNTKRLRDFEATYKESFYKKFQAEAKKHQKNITDILNAQAYLLDFVLWKEAKTSKTILHYFHELSIDLELNTKTYLKYYLSTLDEGKANDETKELFKFYDYLVENEKSYILILTSDVRDALDYTQYLQKIDKNLYIKAFVSELESIKWATLNSVKIIVLEDMLISTSAHQYLEYYHTHIFSKPKIILIGDENKVKSTQYNINKTLPKHTQPKALADAIDSLL